MAFKKPTVRKPNTDITQARIYLRAIPKFGKTTLFRDLVLEKYGDASCGVLLSMGVELGYKNLTNINVVDIDSWGDLIEFKEWILSDDEDAKKIKMICIDTVDELLPLVENEVCRLSKMSDGKKCSINGAFGGYGEGKKKARKMIKRLFYDIHLAGRGIFAISHTKFRTRKATETDEGYQILSSSLSGDYEGVFGDIFDFIVTGVVERDIVDKVSKSEVRKLYFRGNTNIEAGGRFTSKSVPESILFEGDDCVKKFIDTIENGMKENYLDGNAKGDFEKYKKENEKETEKVAEEHRQRIIVRDKYHGYAENSTEDFVKEHFGNEKFSEFVMKTVESNKVKKVVELPIEEKIKIIKYGVEELGLEKI